MLGDPALCFYYYDAVSWDPECDDGFSFDSGGIWAQSRDYRDGGVVEIESSFSCTCPKNRMFPCGDFYRSLSEVLCNGPSRSKVDAERNPINHGIGKLDLWS